MGRARTRIRIGDRVLTPYVIGNIVGRDYKYGNWIVRHVDYDGSLTYTPYKANQLKRFPEYPIGYK